MSCLFNIHHLSRTERKGLEKTAIATLPEKCSDGGDGDVLKTPGYASHDSRVVTSLQSRDIELFNPESDQRVISPHNNTAELFMKIMRIREMVTNLKRFSLSVPKEMHRRVWRIWILVLGCKGLSVNRSDSRCHKP